MQTVLKEEFRRFGEGTTIRGVPRIFKSNSRLVRAMWLLTVLFCLAILTWQLYMTFVGYFQWPIDSIYREANLRPVFPDVTICNIYPMAYASSMELQWDDYLKFTSQRKEMFPYNVTKNNFDVSEDDYNIVWSFIRSPVGYFSSLPVSELHSVELAQDLVIDYNYFAWDWSTSDVQGSFRGVWSPEYSMCYTLKLDKANFTKVRGLSLIIYINNFPKIKFAQTVYTPRPTQAVATGIRVIVHAPGTQPSLKVGMSIGPGTDTTLHVSNTIRTRLPPPHGSCTNQEYLDEPGPSDDGASAEAYSKDACYDVCLQRTIVERCGCVSGFLQFTRRQLSLVNRTICGNQTLDAGSDSNLANMDGFKQWACMLKADFDLESCEKQCVDPCEENLYDVVASSAPWPHVTKQLDFFSTYVYGNENYKIESEKFTAYTDILNAYPELSADELVEKLKQVRLLEENFIQLNVVFDKINPMILKSVPALTSEKMLSMIGGTLSLWLGITVMNAVEFVDFIYAVLIAVRKRSAMSSSVNTMENQTGVFTETSQSNSHC